MRGWGWDGWRGCENQKLGCAALQAAAILVLYNLVVLKHHTSSSHRISPLPVLRYFRSVRFVWVGPYNPSSTHTHTHPHTAGDQPIAGGQPATAPRRARHTASHVATRRHLPRRRLRAGALRLLRLRRRPLHLFRSRALGQWRRGGRDVVMELACRPGGGGGAGGARHAAATGRSRRRGVLEDGGWRRRRRRQDAPRHAQGGRVAPQLVFGRVPVLRSPATQPLVPLPMHGSNSVAYLAFARVHSRRGGHSI